MDQMHAAFKTIGSDIVAKASAFRQTFEANFARIDHSKLDWHDNSQLRMYMYELSKQLVEHGFMFRVPGDIYDDFRTFNLEIIYFPQVIQREMRAVEHEKDRRKVDRSFFTVTFSFPKDSGLIDPFVKVSASPVVITKRGETFVIDGDPLKPLLIESRYADTVTMGFEHLVLPHVCDNLPEIDDEDEYF
jgi:hypothetical protein